MGEETITDLEVQIEQKKMAFQAVQKAESPLQELIAVSLSCRGLNFVNQANLVVAGRYPTTFEQLDYLAILSHNYFAEKLMVIDLLFIRTTQSGELSTSSQLYLSWQRMSPIVNDIASSFYINTNCTEDFIFGMSWIICKKRLAPKEITAAIQSASCDKQARIRFLQKLCDTTVAKATLSSHQALKQKVRVLIHSDLEPSSNLQNENLDISHFGLRQGEDFITFTYNALFGREPSFEERIALHRELAHNKHRVAKTLFGLLRTPEGKLKKIKIRGLYWHYINDLFTLIPILGRGVKLINYMTSILITVVKLPKLTNRIAYLEKKIQLYDWKNQAHSFANNGAFNELLSNSFPELRIPLKKPRPKSQAGSAFEFQPQNRYSELDNII